MHTHTVSKDGTQVDFVIDEGMYWAHTELAMYADGTMPDLADWTATFTAWPDMDPTQTAVIALTSSDSITLGIGGADEIETTLASTAAAGAESITVDDDTGLEVGRYIAVKLDAGELFLTTIAGLPGSDVVTLTLPLPSAATSANDVWSYAQTNAVHNVLVEMGAAVTSGFEPWGQGKYNLDLIDPFSHPVYRFSGLFCFERGKDHG